MANHKLGHLAKEKAEAICHACDELIDPECTDLGENRRGKLDELHADAAFCVDSIFWGHVLFFNT